jgi:hypothetical protein
MPQDKMIGRDATQIASGSASTMRTSRVALEERMIDLICDIPDCLNVSTPT